MHNKIIIKTRGTRLLTDMLAQYSVYFDMYITQTHMVIHCNLFQEMLHTMNGYTL